MNRKQATTAFSFLSTIFLLLLVVFFQLFVPEDLTVFNRIITAENVSSENDEKITEHQSLVARVIDGDTIELADGQKVRYIGIDTPEPRGNVGKECFADQATEFNKQLVEGKIVTLTTDVSETDRYGRLLRYVWVDDVFVNQELVEKGFAYAKAYPPDTLHQELFSQVETLAQSQQLGLWQKCQ